MSVYGAVRRPAIYELKGEKTAEQAIETRRRACLPDADAKLGQLERILPSRLREMQNIDLTVAAGRATPLDNGDKLKIPEIRPTLENSVVLSGYVFRPGQFEYHAGLRLSDVLSSFDELKPEADLHYIMIRREVPPDERIEVISADLEARAGRARARRPIRSCVRAIRSSCSICRRAATAYLEPIIRDLELQATPGQARASRQHRRPGEGAGQVSARTRRCMSAI